MIVATFIYPRTRPQMRDPDNATASLKEVIDAVVRPGVVIDDGPGRIDLRIAQEIGEGRRLMLQVTPLGEVAPIGDRTGMWPGSAG